MVGVKEAVFLLTLVISCGSTPGGALTEISKMAVGGLDEAEPRKNEKHLLSAADAEEGNYNEDEDDVEQEADGGGSKFTGGQKREFKRKYAFRSDLGKRSHIYYKPEIEGIPEFVEKRYRSFKADLGKRYSRFRSDLGKRLERESNPRRLDAPEGNSEEEELGGAARNLFNEKRPKFRADLGKRNRYEASRRVFRADLGKRRMFRSDLG